MNSKQLRTFNLGAAAARAASKQKDAEQSEELKELRLKAARYDLIRENIDYDLTGKTGFYWHNQRGEFAFRVEADGTFPEFEEVIDAELATRGKLP